MLKKLVDIDPRQVVSLRRGGTHLTRDGAYIGLVLKYKARRCEFTDQGVKWYDEWDDVERAYWYSLS